MKDKRGSDRNTIAVFLKYISRNSPSSKGRGGGQQRNENYTSLLFDICVNIKLKYQYLTNRDDVLNVAACKRGGF